MFKAKNSLSDAEVSVFCQQIGMIIKAGLPIHYGISILRDEANDAKSKTLYESIYKPISQGVTLSTALSDKQYFPPYVVWMIRLGEQTGRLEEVLDSLSAYYERESNIRASIRHALVYPITMTSLMVLVLLIILSRVVPVFSSVYKELIGPLSGTSLILLQISNFLNEHILAIIATIVFLSIGGFLFYCTGFGKVLFQGKGLSMSVASSRFANCMHLTLASGLDVDRSLELAQNTVDNPYMAEKIKKCKMLLKHGEDFVSALIHAGIFSRIYAGLLLIAAKTGSLVDVMKQISIAYEKTIDEKIHRFLTILEPILVIILSIFVGLILFSFVLPLLGIMSGIGY